MTLTPAAGPPTHQVTVGGSGYGPTETVEIYFDNALVRLASTNGSGAFSGITFKVPSFAEPGDHWITAEGRRTRESAQKRFTVRTNWSQFGRLPRHRRFNPFENTLHPFNVNGLEEAWRFSTAGDVWSSPAVAGGVVYVGSFDRNVRAFSLAPEPE